MIAESPCVTACVGCASEKSETGLQESEVRTEQWAMRRSQTGASGRSIGSSATTTQSHHETTGGLAGSAILGGLRGRLGRPARRALPGEHGAGSGPTSLANRTHPPYQGIGHRVASSRAGVRRDLHRGSAIARTHTALDVDKVLMLERVTVAALRQPDFPPSNPQGIANLVRAKCVSSTVAQIAHRGCVVGGAI